MARADEAQMVAARASGPARARPSRSAAAAARGCAAGPSAAGRGGRASAGGTSGRNALKRGAKSVISSALPRGVLEHGDEHRRVLDIALRAVDPPTSSMAKNPPCPLGLRRLRPPSRRQNTGSPSKRGKQDQTMRACRSISAAIMQLPMTARSSDGTHDGAILCGAFGRQHVAAGLPPRPSVGFSCHDASRKAIGRSAHVEARIRAVAWRCAVRHAAPARP